MATGGNTALGPSRRSDQLMGRAHSRRLIGGLALKPRPQLRRIRRPSAVAFRLPPGPTINLTSASAVGPSGSPE